MSKENLAKRLIEIGAIRFGTFVLKSGRISNYYVDIKYASTFPDVLRLIVEELSKKVSEYDLMAGIELGSVPLMAATSIFAGIPYLIVRKREKNYGIKDRIIGNYKKGQRVVIVEDVTTTGSSALEVADLLSSVGLLVEKVVCVVDREEGASENISKRNLIFEPILRVSEIRKYGV